MTECRMRDAGRFALPLQHLASRLYMQSLELDMLLHDIAMGKPGGRSFDDIEERVQAIAAELRDAVRGRPGPPKAD